jgi:hypothetical protein
MWDCASLLHSAQMLFEIILMKFDAIELHEAALFLRPFSQTQIIFMICL